MAHQHRLRIGRHSEPQRCYLLTSATRGRQPIFETFAAARIAVEELARMDAAGMTYTWCYVIMPDHIHWLVQLLEGATLEQVMRCLKSRSAWRLGGRIWQRGYHDHALRDEAQLLPTARYVVMNPVRAGLVTRIGEYPHWDACWLKG